MQRSSVTMELSCYGSWAQVNKVFRLVPAGGGFYEVNLKEPFVAEMTDAQLLFVKCQPKLNEASLKLVNIRNNVQQATGTG